MRSAIAPAVLAVLALAGCGGDEPAPPSTTSASQCAEIDIDGLPLSRAEDLAEAGGCHVEAASVDGVPQPLTRELDPTRIKVDVRNAHVTKVVGVG